MGVQNLADKHLLIMFKEIKENTISMKYIWNAMLLKYSTVYILFFICYIYTHNTYMYNEKNKITFV